MPNRKFLQIIKKFRSCILLLLLLPLKLHASFIEATTGTAVTNDATAAYYNPAALTLLNNPQFILLGTVGNLNTQFNGQITQPITGFTEIGSSSSNSYYYLPSLYLGVPTTNNITFGLSMMANTAFRDSDEASILRYAQASNNIQDYDVVPAIEIKINNYLALGAGINVSSLNFSLNPIIGFPGSNIADAESNNQADGTGIGGNAGFLLQPCPSLKIGFDYRSSTAYQLNGTSIFNGTQQVFSDNYHFEIWTPAHSTLSASYFLSPQIGFIGTAQFIQWSIFNNINAYGIALLSGTQPAIINATIPYHWHDSWVFTLGNIYNITPKWVLRIAGSYLQAPGNPNYQIVNGNSIILGTSMGYEINKIVTIDGSYAHAFIQDEDINISGRRSLIEGTNDAERNVVSLKLTFNIL